MIKGLFWCFVMLIVQLGVLRYVDLRVASMPRLDDAAVTDDVATLPDTPVDKLDA
jgi:hypothetical protein